MIQERSDWIISEYQVSGELSEFGRQQLVNSMVDFMYMFFEVTSIQKTHKLMTLSTVLQIFPKLAPEEMVDHFMVIKNFILK